MRTDLSKMIKTFIERVAEHRERIITNTVLIGQVPPISAVLKQDEVDNPNTNLRTRAFVERLTEIGVDECTVDAAGNPIGLIKGSEDEDEVIILAAHMDTVYQFDQEVHLSVDTNQITGPGLIDNSISLGVLLSLPEILQDLGSKFRHDIVILGLAESLGDSNLSGIRQFLEFWKRPIAAGIILEGGELGRLNYFSRAMVRMEIRCAIPSRSGWENKYGNNAILIINEVINRILAISLPQRPVTQIILGKISGGVKHGDRALAAVLGLEIESEDDHTVAKVSSEIEAIVESVSHEYSTALNIRRVSSVNAAKLSYGHPLVKSAIRVMDALDINPRVESSESELSIFLHHQIPAVTLGVTHGENYHRADARVEIEPIYRGIAQVLALLAIIDRGME